MLITKCPISSGARNRLVKKMECQRGRVGFVGSFSVTYSRTDETVSFRILSDLMSAHVKKQH